MFYMTCALYLVYYHSWEKGSDRVETEQGRENQGKLRENSQVGREGDGIRGGGDGGKGGAGLWKQGEGLGHSRRVGGDAGKAGRGGILGVGRRGAGVGVDQGKAR